MDVITTPIVRQSKIDLIHKQVIRPLLHGDSHFVITKFHHGASFVMKHPILNKAPY